MTGSPMQQQQLAQCSRHLMESYRAQATSQVRSHHPAQVRSALLQAQFHFEVRPELRCRSALFQERPVHRERLRLREA